MLLSFIHPRQLFCIRDLCDLSICTIYFMYFNNQMYRHDIFGFLFYWWLFFSFPWLSQDCVQQHFFVPSISWACYTPPFPIPLSAVFFALSFTHSPGVIAPRNLLYVNLFPGRLFLCTFPFLLFSKEKRIQLYDLNDPKMSFVRIASSLDLSFFRH